MELDKNKTKTTDREIRALPLTLEVRAGEEGESGTRTITGAIKYNQDSHEMRDWGDDVFVEQIAPGAFSDSLSKRSVAALWSHETSKVLGNTKSGTLRLADTDAELRFEIDIPDTSVGNDTWELVRRGDIDGVSFGMKVTKDQWVKEKRGDQTIYKRTVLGADLFEISPLAFPAYPGNTVSARSLEDFKSEERKAADAYEKEKILLELELY